MKVFTLIIALFCTNLLFGQTWEQKSERAAYESKAENVAFYSTTITITNAFNQDLYDLISEKFMGKDGIVNMRIGKNDQTIIVIHKDNIIFETFKALINMASETSTYEISEPQRFLY